MFTCDGDSAGEDGVVTRHASDLQDHDRKAAATGVVVEGLME